MSRTKQPYRPTAVDFYPTPAWCVHRLLERVDLPGGEWLEPAVGNGAIVTAAQNLRRDISWTTMDIRATMWVDYLRDFLAFPPPPGTMFDVVITNPPYNRSLDFVETSMHWAPIVVMLLRLDWLTSQKRNAFIQEHLPDVYVLPNRPSFTNQGTDSTGYAWFVWGQDGGRIEVLDLTPKEERKR